MFKHNFWAPDKFKDMFKDCVTDKIVILSKLGKDLELVSSSLEPNMEVFAVS